MLKKKLMVPGHYLADIVEFEKNRSNMNLGKNRVDCVFSSLTFSIHPKPFLGLYVMLKKNFMVFGHQKARIMIDFLQ
jgi:hypothetical protein